jgi:hypothetical protein
MGKSGRSSNGAMKRGSNNTLSAALYPLTLTVNIRLAAFAVLRRMKIYFVWAGSIAVVVFVHCLMQMPSPVYWLWRRGSHSEAGWPLARPKSSLALHLSIVHNKEAERLEHLLPHTESMCQTLGTNWQVTKNEFFEQPAVKVHSFAVAYIQTVMYWLLGRWWASHRRMPNDYWPLPLFSRIEIGKVRRFGAIEMIVAVKHIAAWRKFLDSKGDYLIMMESDAIFLHDSETRMQRCLATVAPPDRLLYIDLAGGLGRDILKVDHIISCEHNGFTHFDLPATNTACVYLLSRAAVRSFCATLDRLPYLRWIGIDWMINAIMMEHVRQGLSISCMHASPPIFRHGSFAGQYDAWKRHAT